MWRRARCSLTPSAIARAAITRHTALASCSFLQCSQNHIGGNVGQMFAVPANLVILRHIHTKLGRAIQKNNKVVASADEALDGLVLHGATVTVGGFGLCGIPETLISALARNKEAQALTAVSLTASVDGFGLGKLFETPGKVKRMVSSYVGENKVRHTSHERHGNIFLCLNRRPIEFLTNVAFCVAMLLYPGLSKRQNFESMYLNGQIEVELVPQGTLAKKMQVGGSGIPAFFTPTGAGTLYALGGIPIKYKEGKPGEVEIFSEPKERREFKLVDGTSREFVMEEAIVADVALVKAYKADTRGNLVFRGTARNANPDVAKSGRVCIAEAEIIVPAGQLDPDEIHLPGIYVHKVILATENEKRIERLRETSISGANGKKTDVAGGGRGRIMRRAAKEFKEGMRVNLGIGIPTMASNYVPEGVLIELHSGM